MKRTVKLNQGMIEEMVMRTVNNILKEDYDYYNSYTDRNYNDAFESEDGSLLQHIIEKSFGDIDQFDEFMDALGEAINDDSVDTVKALVHREMGQDFDDDEYPEDITDSDDIAGL